LSAKMRPTAESSTVREQNHPDHQPPRQADAKIGNA
jgi:hypothetical protein